MVAISPAKIQRPRVAHFCGRKPFLFDRQCYSRPFTIARLEHHRRHHGEFGAWLAVLKRSGDIGRQISSSDPTRASSEGRTPETCLPMSPRPRVRFFDSNGVASHGEQLASSPAAISSRNTHLYLTQLPGTIASWWPATSFQGSCSAKPKIQIFIT